MNTYRLIDADYVLVATGFLWPMALNALVDTIRDRGYRLGLASLTSPSDVAYLTPMLHGAKSVAVVGSETSAWSDRLRSALQDVHPAIPRLYSVLARLPVSEEDATGDQLSRQLPSIVESMAGYTAQDLQITARP
jgi:pyruvate/2-oxoacid:ferredoxin oxidoreductase alpha subunit